MNERLIIYQELHGKEDSNLRTVKNIGKNYCQSDERETEGFPTSKHNDTRLSGSTRSLANTGEQEINQRPPLHQPLLYSAVGGQWETGAPADDSSLHHQD